MHFQCKFIWSSYKTLLIQISQKRSMFQHLFSAELPLSDIILQQVVQQENIHCGNTKRIFLNKKTGEDTLFILLPKTIDA